MGDEFDKIWKSDLSEPTIAKYSVLFFVFIALVGICGTFLTIWVTSHSQTTILPPVNTTNSIKTDNISFISGRNCYVAGYNSTTNSLVKFCSNSTVIGIIGFQTNLTNSTTPEIIARETFGNDTPGNYPETTLYFAFTGSNALFTPHDNLSNIWVTSHSQTTILPPVNTTNSIKTDNISFISGRNCYVAGYNSTTNSLVKFCSNSTVIGIIGFQTNLTNSTTPEIIARETFGNDTPGNYPETTLYFAFTGSNALFTPHDNLSNKTNG